MNNSTSIVRQLKIDLITDQPNHLLEWFNDIWCKLNIVETNVYHQDGNEFIYYVDNNRKKQWIFFQDNNNERFLCNYNHYWSYLKSKMELSHDDIQEVTVLLVENALNIHLSTPHPGAFMSLPKVENALNDHVAALDVRFLVRDGRLDNALNNNIIKIVSPSLAQWQQPSLVENALNKTTNE